MGLAVRNPSELETVDCDCIVIANTYDRSRRALYKELIKKYPSKKVNMIDEQLILSEKTREDLGFIRFSCNVRP